MSDMIGRRCGISGIGVASLLSLAATPIFAVAFVVEAMAGGGADGFCSVARHVSPLGGMAGMYLLMSVFHVPAWVRLASGTGS